MCKTYKEACKHPEGGAVKMDYENILAIAAQTLAKAHGFQAKMIYEWAIKHSVNLVRHGPFLVKEENLWKFLAWITEQKDWQDPVETLPKSFGEQLLEMVGQEN